MRRQLAVWALAGSLAVTAACARPEEPAPAATAAPADTASPAVARVERPTVILLSLDGLRHDQVHDPALPGIGRFLRDGARAERLVPPFPSNTFPGHVSLATGTHPDRHGIVDNRFVDPERGLYDYDGDADWIEAEPLWAAAERQGVRAAVFFWVGSETAWRGTAASLRRTPFDTRVPEREKVDQILAWLDLPRAERPQLVMAWWHGVDRAAHRHLAESVEAAEALHEQGAQLERLLTGLDARDAWSHTTLLVTSDHGMTASDRRVDARAALSAAGIAAHVLHSGGVAHVYLERPDEAPGAAAALAALEDVDAWPLAELPERLRSRHARMGHVVAMARPPASFRAARGLAPRIAAALGRPVGMHGYDPELPEMAAVFLALGRGVPAGTRLPALHAVDVAPTVAALLGMEPPASSEGRAHLPLEDAP